MKAWINDNRALNKQEMEQNAELFARYMFKQKWSIESISAMLGNMQTESTINPGRLEVVDIQAELQKDPTFVYNWLDWGAGLVQWTPASKLVDWTGENLWNDGNKQCDRLCYERDNNLQWFANPDAPIPQPPLTFLQFSRSKKKVEELANYFLWYYEHPASIEDPSRAEQAKTWYKFVKGLHLEKSKWWIYLTIPDYDRRY